MIQFTFSGNPTSEELQESKQNFLDRMSEEMRIEYTTEKNLFVNIDFNKDKEDNRINFSIAENDNLHNFIVRFNEHLKSINTSDQ